MTPDQIANTYNLKRRGHRWAGPCPKCGGSSSSDKFVLREDGGFKCYGCDFRGDAITWHRQMEGLSCPDAHDAAGQDCRLTSCPARGTCRLGDGSGRARKRTARSVAPEAAERRDPRTTVQRDPAETWRTWAARFVDRCAEQLQEHHSTLAWLQQRGIAASRSTGIEWGLGYNTHASNIDRASIGLPPEKDGKTTLWIPAGLVIPTFDDQGRVHRLRIRRTDADRQRFLSDRKYVWIEGSGNAPMMLRAAETPARGAIVVEAELDAIAIASAHPAVDAIALGTVSMPPTAEQDLLLRQAPVILVALDADPGTPQKPGPGIKAFGDNWRRYPHARFWPVPAGKDPGDYVKDHGGNLHHLDRRRAPAPSCRPGGENSRP